MIENFTERVITSEDTRRQMIQALGFDEPATAEKLSRHNFSSDEDYFAAVAELSVKHNSPEYREAYRKVRREYNAQKRAEEQATAEARHKAEIAQAIKDCVLRPEEQARVDDDARCRAQADLAAGRISFQQMGATVTKYAERLTQAAKEEKVHTADFNQQLREAIAKAAGRSC